MKIKLLRNTVASGTHLEAGKTYDVDEGDAKLILAAGRAVKSSDPATPQPEQQEEAPKRRRAAAE